MNKYNQLTVLEEVKHKNRLMYRTQCDCGRIDLKRKDWVIRGRTTSCKNCASKRTAINYPPPVHRTGCKGLSGTHYLAIKNGAARRNIPFNLSAVFLWNLFEDQKRKCALTGLPLVLEASLKNNNVNWDVVTASLDRIDNTKGYEEDNVWWVDKRINRLKNNYSLEELLYWSSLLLKKHGNPDLSVLNTIEVGTKEQRLGGEDVTNNPPTSAQHPDSFPYVATLLFNDETRVVKGWMKI